MPALDRRSFLLGSGATLASVSNVWAHPHPPPGRWTSLSGMLFPARDIYAAPFYSEQIRRRDTDKPEPFNIIVVAGGATPNALHNITDSVAYYDPGANRWSYATPLPEPRRQVALVNHNGFLFAIGGYAHDDATQWMMRGDCWRLDALDGAWMSMRPLPHPQTEAVCVSLNRLVHFVGGRAPYGSRNRNRRDHIDTDQHWAYDARDNDWRKLAPMPTSRSGAAGAVLGDALHVIGGRSDGSGDLRTHEVYDPLADRWATAAPLPKARSRLAAAVLGEESDGGYVHKIYAFGGAQMMGNGDVFADVWSYDRREDKWRTAAAMKQPRLGCAAAAFDEAIYLAGGAATIRGDANAALDKFEIRD